LTQIDPGPAGLSIWTKPPHGIGSLKVEHRDVIYEIESGFVTSYVSSIALRASV